jgi:putative transposase
VIKELRSDYPLAVLCRVLSVSCSGYHAWILRPPSKRTQARERLKVAAQAAHQRTRRTYGAQRLQKELASVGFTASLGTIKRVRRELGLRCVQQKKRFRVTTTDSRHTLPVAANLLEQRFTATRPDEVWAAHITYVATAEGWLYVAAIKDLFAGEARRAQLWREDDNRSGRAGSRTRGRTAATAWWSDPSLGSWEPVLQ